MADFETSVELDVEVDDASLRAARDEIEDEMGTVSADINTRGATATDGGAPMGDALDELSDQTDLLEDILDELETGGVGGGGGGGGVGGLLPGLGGGDGGGTGLLDTVIGAGILQQLGGGGGGGIGGLGRIRGGLITTALTGTLTEGAGGTTESFPDPEDPGPINQFIADLTRPAGQELSGLFGGGQDGESLASEREDLQRLIDELDTLDIDQPQWVDDLTSGLGGGPSGEGVVDTSDIRGDPALTPPGFGSAAVEAFNVGQRLQQTPAGNRVGTSDLAGDPSLQNRAQQQQAQRFQITVRNEISNQLDLSGLRGLQRFIRDPERFIKNNLNLESGRP